MNLDKAIKVIEQGLTNPDTIIRRVPIKADELAKYDMRRQGTEPIQYVWMITVGEQGANPSAWFMERSLTKVMKKALAWRGVQPKKRIRKSNGPVSQPQTTG